MLLNAEISAYKFAFIGSESDDENDEESSSDEEFSDDESSECFRFYGAQIPHHGGINRIRSCKISQALVCAVWNDEGKVQIWNLAAALRTVDTLEGRSKTEVLKTEKPLFSFSHNVEGYALVS